jgi:glycosyltransferase involved in cell wall biosynthesis
MKIDHEIIFIDDGSVDGSWKVIEELSANDPAVKGIKFRRNYGKSAALNSGFSKAGGDVVITMDADLQDSPDEIPELYRMIREDGYDIVSGWKKKRYDPFIKNFTSKFYNWTTRKMSGIRLHDFNCGLKAYRKEVIKTIDVYGEMHRYIPLIAKWAGFTNIGEKVVVHRKRMHGVTKFGIERFINGFLDLMSVSFVSRFGKRPMHFFGTIGTLFFVGGGIISLWIIIEKIYNSLNGIKGRGVTDQPLFYLALLAMIIGTQLFLSGFLAELLTRNNPEKSKYLIDKYLKIDPSDEKPVSFNNNVG